jgi:hypothetical protein
MTDNPLSIIQIVMQPPDDVIHMSGRQNVRERSLVFQCAMKVSANDAQPHWNHKWKNSDTRTVSL